MNVVDILHRPDVGDGVRFGNRVTAVGEKPYLDPKVSENLSLGSI